MKMKHGILGIIITLLPSLALAAKGGAGDAGGGHGFSSTPEEIRAYAANLPGKSFSRLQVDWGWAADRFEMAQLLNPIYAPNETVKRIDLALQRAYLSKSFFEELKRTKIEVKDVCRGSHGEVVDSSTPHKLGSPFCINAKTLSRYPSESLKPELISLLFHEWSHQLGYGENEAIEFQNYVKHYIGIVLATFDDPVFPTPLRIGGWQKIKKADSTVTIRCMTAEQYGREWGNNFKDTEFVLLSGQAVKIRGEGTLSQTVTCGDLPELDCSAPVKSPEFWCGGNLVYFGPDTKKDWICVDDPDGHTLKYSDLQQQRICRPSTP
ncbi:MAG: hypothetical protein ACXVB9_00980 [Bdellovibrionota bacterium]